MSANVGKVYNLTSSGGSGSLTLESISVTTAPKKTTYKSGEAFDPTGMEVTASYGYGITSVVTGYTVSPATLTDGVTEITVTYTEGRITKTATTPVTVEKVLSSIAVTKVPTKVTYAYLESFDPAGMTVTATFSDGSTATATGWSYPETAFATLGTQQVSIQYTYEGVQRETTVEVTVSAAEVAIPIQNGTLTYNETEQTPSWTGYDTVKMAISGDISGTNAGDYTARFTLNYGYIFTDGTDTAAVTWTIQRAVIASLPVQSNTLAADGTVKSPEWSGYDATKMTISGTTNASEAGDYEVIFTPKSNFQWWDDSTEGKTATWTIASVLVTIPSQSGSITYDGSEHTPEWDGFDSENSSVSVSPQTNAGDYTAVFTLLTGMWTDGSTGNKTVPWTIGRATITDTPVQSGTPTYDGNPKTPDWSGYDSTQLTLEVTAMVNAGDYTASFTPTSNYQWPDGSVSAKVVSWSIARATCTVSVSPTSLELGLSATSGVLTVTRSGDGVITVVSDNTNVATVGAINQTSGEVTINTVDETSGTANLTVSVAEGSNYLAAEDVVVPVKASFREYLYGFDLTNSDSNPDTRVSYPSDVDNASFTAAKMTFGGSFSYGSWPSTPGEKFMPAPCMLKYDGTVDHYLNPDDYTKKTDGTASSVADTSFGGNAMMEWPKIYVKRWESDGVYHFRCSDVKVDDEYECWCNYDRNDNEIPHFYTPIYFGSNVSSKLRSISGQSNMVSQTADTEVTYAKANGDDWYTEVLADRLLLQDLLVLMFKSTDLQTALGYGVVSASAAIAPGTMNTKGLFWGASDKTSGVKAFGMENPWGNLWRRTAGWIHPGTSSGSHKVKLTRGTKDGSTATDYNTDGSGYLEISGTAFSSGYISGMQTKPYGRIPIAHSGSTTTYEADYVWYHSSARVCYAYVGGDWGNDLYAGPFGASLPALASFTNTSIGAALSCKPLAAA